MKTIKLILAFLVFASVFVGGEGQTATTRPACSEVIGKFFPTSLVAANFGTIAESYVPYAAAGREQCAYQIINQTSRTRSTDSVFVSVSTGNPNTRLNCASGRKLSIGDDSCISDHGGRAKKNNFIFDVNAYIYVYNAGSSELKKVPTEVERLLTHAVSQVVDLGDPTINSVRPQNTTAGIRLSYHETTGVIVYGVNREYFEITGQNLTGSSVTSDHKNVDGSPAIRFSGISVSPSGRQITGFINVSDKAKDGRANITVTNLSGKSATTEININITGTQYLKRKFASQAISFNGDWPQLMPNSEALRVESLIYGSLEAINKPTYKSLGIHIRVFEQNLWRNHAALLYCGVAWAWGCSGRESQYIYTSTSGYFDRNLLHEAAHKLHYFYLGYVRSTRLRPLPKGQFTSEWQAAAGDLSQCKYLPLDANRRWSNTNMDVPRCGFGYAYGAYSYSSSYSPFAEDVATLVELRKFSSGFLQTGDGPTDPRYPLKYSILDRYGF